MFLYLKNLSSTEVFQGDPWEIKVQIPEKVREDKQERDKWINKPSTKHCVYSLWEGLNPKLRVSSKKGSENPPAVCYGIAFDFDAVTSEEKRRRVLNRLPFDVFMIENTLTKGHWRAVMVLERPIKFVSEGMAKHFLSTLLKEWKPGSGIDKGSFLDPGRYWTSSGDFKVLGDKVSEKDCIALETIAARTYKYAEFHEGVNFKADEIYKALCAKYPDFQSKWEGDFDFEAQGPSFWVQGSESPKSAIIKANGIYTFSAHAEKPFYTWGELLGREFVAEKKDAAFQEITKRMYRTARAFYAKMEDGRWRDHDRADLNNMLRVDFGLSSKIKDSGTSEVDDAIAYIRNNRRIDGVAPFIFNKNEIVRLNGKRILNEINEQTGVMQPSKEKAVWGPQGNMSWLSKFFDTFFTNGGESLPVYLSWLSRFYRSGYYSKPQSGQVCIIAGGPGIGKTFLTDVILGGIFGAPADPGAFLTGRDSFGAQLFQSSVWAINDGSVGTDMRTKKKYAELLKASVANRSHVYHEKFKMPVEGLHWLGRVTITCNTDPHSLRAVVPDMEISNLDKIMLFQAVDKPQADFLPDDGHMEQVLKELPVFCRFLLDYIIPEELKGPKGESNRYGVKSYHDPELLQKVSSTSTSSSIWSVLVDFMNSPGMFLNGKKEMPYRDYSAVALHNELNTLYEAAMRGISLGYFTQHLEHLAQTTDRVIQLTGSEGSIWRLTND